MDKHSLRIVLLSEITLFFVHMEHAYGMSISAMTKWKLQIVLEHLRIYYVIYLLCLFVKHNALELSFSLAFCTTFRGYRQIQNRKIFYKQFND